jgi:hypothetical protein
MCSRQYVAQGATGCPAKGKTIAIQGGGFFYRYMLSKIADKEQEYFMNNLCKASTQQMEGRENARLF